MRTIPEIVAQMRELIEELEEHTGKPPAKQESPGFDFSFDNMHGQYQATDTISLSGVGGLPAFTLHDIKPLNSSDLSFTTKS